jgi:hypothetical protein
VARVARQPSQRGDYSVVNVIQIAQRVFGKVIRVEMAPRRRPGDPAVPVGAADRARGAWMGTKALSIGRANRRCVEFGRKKRRRYGEWPANRLRCLNLKEGQAAHPLLLQPPCHAISILA